jgi:hypothetical protein
MARTLSRPRSSSSLAALGDPFAVSLAARAWLVIPASMATGLLIAVLWSAQLADDTVGVTVASKLVGTDAATTSIGNSLFAMAFAIAAGLGTTFTACNVCVFSCIAPLAREKGATRASAGRLMGLMAAGIVLVTLVYGVVGALFGSSVPSLSTSMTTVLGHKYPVRLLQSDVVFTVLGLVLLAWGLTTLQVIRNPFRALTARYAWLTPVFLGVIIGGFTVGRPYPLFHKLFIYASQTGDPLLAGVLTALQGLMNVALMGAIFLLLSRGTGGRFEAWLTSKPLRAATITAVSLFIGGAFLISYWTFRVPAVFGVGWFFPHN